jgi:trigger factor
MKAEKIHREQEKNRLNVMEKILSETKAVIPNILIEAELDRMFYRMKADIQSMGLSYEDYMKHLGKSETDMRNELRADAEKRVKMELIVSEIATKENIQPNKEELEKQVQEVMAQYPGADKGRAEAYVEQVMINEGVFKLLEGK